MLERKYLGLGHILQGEKVDSTVEYTSRIEFLWCSDSLKSFDHGHSSRRVFDLFAFLPRLPVHFPDAYRYRVQTNERRRNDTLVQTMDMDYQQHHPGGRSGSSTLTIVVVIFLIRESQLESVGYDAALVPLGTFEQVSIALEHRLR